jgi:flagellar M-ring protein FliF
MFESLTKFFSQIQANFNILSTGKKATVAGVALCTVLGIVVLIVWTNRLDYQPLYFNLNPEDAGAVVEALKEQKIPYRLSANGRTVMVPGERVYDLRLDLASRGVPSRGGIGFEIFDRTDLGTTEFVQKLNYQRALQGELARTISQIGEVEQARVHITLPEKSLFLEDEQKPTASVVVKLRHNGLLKEKQVQGIVHLVAGSVEGLEPENIAVVDADGTVLSSGTSDDSRRAGLTGNQSEFQRELEEGLERRVQTMLEKVVGKDKAIVRVAATLDFKQEEKTEEIFDPDSAVVRSEQRAEEKSAGRTPLAMGIPGVASNIPEGEGGSSVSMSSSDAKKTNETMNYEINKVVKRIIEPTGVIKRLSVAVLLDGTYEATKAKDGKETHTYVPIPGEKLATYRDIVMKAVGYNEERGDQIEVSNVAFETVRLTDEEKQTMEREDLLQKVWKMVPYLVIISLAALLILLVLRPLLQWLAAPETGAVARIPAGRTLAELEGETPAGFLKAGISGREQVVQLARADAHQFAELLRNWIK